MPTLRLTSGYLVSFFQGFLKSSLRLDFRYPPPVKSHQYREQILLILKISICSQILLTTLFFSNKKTVFLSPETTFSTPETIVSSAGTTFSTAGTLCSTLETLFPGTETVFSTDETTCSTDGTIVPSDEETFSDGEKNFSATGDAFSALEINDLRRQCPKMRGKENCCQMRRI